MLTDIKRQLKVCEMSITSVKKILFSWPFFFCFLSMNMQILLVESS